MIRKFEWKAKESNFFQRNSILNQKKKKEHYQKISSEKMKIEVPETRIHKVSWFIPNPIIIYQKYSYSKTSKKYNGDLGLDLINVSHPSSFSMLAYFSADFSFSSSCLASTRGSFSDYLLTGTSTSASFLGASTGGGDSRGGSSIWASFLGSWGT